MVYINHSYQKTKSKYLEFLKSQEVLSEPFRDKIGQLNNFYLPISKEIAKSYKKIKKYCELSHHNRWTKCCAMSFPAIFVNLEKCYANYLLGSAINERDMLHSKYQKTNTKAKAFRRSIRKIKKFDFQAYFKITQNINDKQKILVEISKIHSKKTQYKVLLFSF